MKYRLSFVVLLALLIVSGCFNWINYSAAVTAEEELRIDNICYPRIIAGLHTELLRANDNNKVGAYYE